MFVALGAPSFDTLIDIKVELGYTGLVKVTLWIVKSSKFTLKLYIEAEFQLFNVSLHETVTLCNP